MWQNGKFAGAGRPGGDGGKVNGGILGGVLSGNRGMAVSMARTLLNTMPQAITSTKMVRMAVARLELMPWTPILPRIAVRLANNAESPA